MPNWVYNSMSVSGSQKDLIAFRDKASKPYTTKNKGKRYQDAEGNWKWDADVEYEQENTSPLSFWNFIEPESKDAYFADAHGKKPEGYEAWSMEDKMAYDLKFTGDGWYDWNVRNWGTKWDASDAEITDGTDDEKTACLSYTFQTAWSIPEPVFTAMVRQHPELTFDFECEEEQGWGAEFTSSDGDDVDENGVLTKSLIMTREWDIPDSHADYVDRGRECWACDDGDEENLYEDCPRSETDFVVVVERRYIVKAQTAEKAWEITQDTLDELTPEDLDTIRVVDENTGELLFPKDLTAE
jgi:hypothetical protein